MAHGVGTTRLAFLLMLVACGAITGCAERIGRDGSGPLRAVAYTRDDGGRPPLPAGQVTVVVDETGLRRDAAGWAPVVGKVARGETLTVLDAIDRRLRVLGRVVFDGGYWLKVRGPRGDVGCVSGGHVRGVAKEAA